MILVTGGTGYIGSHICAALAEAGHDIIILDNLSNSRVSMADRLGQLCGKRLQFVRGDIRDTSVLKQVFADYSVEAVIHVAGLKATGESGEKPLEYYDNNVRGTLELLTTMRQAGVRTLVFSSTEAVHGDPVSVPGREDFPRSATNPYARSMLIIEDILADLYHAEPEWCIARLHYFNLVGAHESGLIGENRWNLMPYITKQKASSQREFINVFDNKYPTKDGIAMRDYIHIVELANGHVAALNYLNKRGGLLTVTLVPGRIIL